MKATETMLGDIHGALASWFSTALDELNTDISEMEIEEQAFWLEYKSNLMKQIPNIIKYLKDNDIVCDTEVQETISGLDDKLKAIKQGIKDKKVVSFK